MNTIITKKIWFYFNEWVKQNNHNIFRIPEMLKFWCIVAKHTKTNDMKKENLKKESKNNVWVFDEWANQRELSGWNRSFQKNKY